MKINIRMKRIFDVPLSVNGFMPPTVQAHFFCLIKNRVTMSTSANNERTIVITGGLGNLGSKLCRHLLNNNSNNNKNADDETIIKNKVILLEHPKFIHADKPLPHPNAILIPCDLGSPFHIHTSSDGDSNNNNTLALEDALRNADTLIHFSAVNPYPNATWSESAQSMDHTFNIFTMAIKCKG